MLYKIRLLGIIKKQKKHSLVIYIINLAHNLVVNNVLNVKTILIKILDIACI